LDVPRHVERIGRRIMDAWKAYGEKHRLPVCTDQAYPCLAHFRFEHESSEPLRTLYTHKMLDRGFLAGTSIYPTLAHTDEIVDRYVAAIDEVFGEIAEVLRTGDLDRALPGGVAHSGFRRLL